MWARVRAAIAAALAVAVLAAPGTAAEIDLSRLLAQPNPRLGLAFPGAQTRYYPAIAQAGIGVVRVSVSWARVEPKRGAYQWIGLDDRIRALQSLGIEPFLTFESDAKWATVASTQGVKNARPSDPADWARFVRDTAERYDGDGRDDMPGLRAPVRYWQVANEWISDANRSGGWIGSAEELIAYVRTAHDAVKAASPNAVFVLGGLAAFNIDVLLVARGNQEFRVQQYWGPDSRTVLSLEDMRGPDIARIIDDRVLPVLRGAPFDMADVHLYGPEGRDPARIALIGSLTGKPVLSAECGGPSLDYGGRYSPEAHFLAVVERNLGVLAAGARFCLWFRLGEGEGSTWGNRKTALYTADARPKPGVYAYRMLSRLIDARTQVVRTGPDTFTIGRDGQEYRIGWNTGAAGARDHAARTGGEAYCLADPARGILSSDPAACDATAVVIAGRDLSRLLAP